MALILMKALTFCHDKRFTTPDKAFIYEEILRLMKPFNMHRVPSLEMPELELDKFFLAIIDGNIVGAAGYKMISDTEGKTTLMAVDPKYSGQGIGLELQRMRMNEMKTLGATSIVTNADRPKSIAWYKKHFGYQEVGTIPKIHSFGWEGVDHWTTLKTTDFSLEAAP